MNRSFNRLLMAVLVLSVILRVAGALYMGNTVTDLPGTADQLSYHTLALRLLGGYGFTFGQDWWPATPANAPTAHWSFLYTFYLAFVYLLFGPNPLVARLIQAVVVGVLQPWLVYLIVKSIFRPQVALAAAAITAVYAYFIYYAGTLMTEPFYLTAILGSLYLAILLSRKTGSVRTDRLLAMSLGLALGTAVLLRQLYMLFVPFLFLWILWVGWKTARKRLILPLALSVLVLALMILPFTVYNTARFGHFVLLNTNSGFAFFWGNNPIYGTHFQPLLPDYHALIPKELLSLDEAALDQALLLRGLGFVLSDPVRFLLLSLSRIPVFFQFWPTSDSGLVSNLARVGSFGIFWPFMVYGLFRAAGFLAAPTNPAKYAALLLIGFAVINTGIHLLSWALIRYRLPVDMVLIPFAGVAFVDIRARLEAWSKNHFRGVKSNPTA